MSTYEDVAKECGLSVSQSKKYVTYMKVRWQDSEDTKCKVGYAKEWAVRFKMGRFSNLEFIKQRMLEKIFSNPIFFMENIKD